MATRFYLPSTGAAPVTPAFATWTSTSEADRLTCVTAKIGSPMANKTPTADRSGTINTTSLSRMYVSHPLAAQTLSASTIKGSIRVLESATNDNLDAMRLSVRIVSNDGSTYRSPVVYGPTNSTVAEFNTSLRSKRLATGGATSGVTISAGDRVVIEIGVTNTAGGTTVRESVNYGDDGVADLDDSESDIGTDNPFVELAANLVFLTYGTLSLTDATDTVSSATVIKIAAAAALTDADDALGSSTTYSDDFNRANQTPIGSPWQTGFPTSGNINLTSNTFTTSDASAAVATINPSTASFGPSQSASTTIVTGSESWAGPAIRTNTDRTGYFAYHNGTANKLQMRKFGGVLLAEFTGTLAAGDVLKYQVTGTADFELFKNGVSIGTVTDNSSPVLTGQPGVFASQFFSGDNFVGVDLGGTTGTLRIAAAAALNDGDDTLSSTATLAASAITGTAALTDDTDTVASASVLAGPIASAALTDDTDTVAATATVTLVAAAALTDADDTVAAASTVSGPVASATLTDADDTLSATSTIGNVEITGTAALTDDNDTVASATTLAGPIAAAALTDDNDTVASASVLTLVATATLSDDSDTVASTAVAAATGTASLTDDSDTVASVAVLAGPIAAAALTDDNDTVTAAGVTTLTAASALTDDADTLASTSVTSGPTGSAALTDDNDTVASAAVVTVTASAGLTDDNDSVTSAGVLSGPVAEAALVDDDDTLWSLAGAPIVIADAAITDESDTVVSTAVIGIAAAANLTDDDDAVTSAGSLPVVAALAVADEDDALTAAGSAALVAQASLTDANDSLVATGQAPTLTATATLTDASDVLSSTAIYGSPILAVVIVTDASDTLVSFAGAAPRPPPPLRIGVVSVIETVRVLTPAGGSGRSISPVSGEVTPL